MNCGDVRRAQYQNISSLRLMFFIRLVLLNINSRSIACLCILSGSAIISMQCMRHRRCGFDPGVGKIQWKRAWQPTPVFFLGKSHGQRGLVGYGSWVGKEPDMTEVTEYVCMQNLFRNHLL